MTEMQTDSAGSVLLKILLTLLLFIPVEAVLLILAYSPEIAMPRQLAGIALGGGAVYVWVNVVWGKP